MSRGRRALLQAAASMVAWPLGAPRGQAPSSGWLELEVKGRTLRIQTVVPAAQPRAVVIFSHGLGASPEAYASLQDALVAAAIAVVSPLHVDSLKHPQRAQFSMQATFGERVADLQAAVAMASQRWPGVPLACIGHSYGSLLSWCLGGALAYVADFRQPAVKAVVAFSSPGAIPGLVVPDKAYATLKVPSLTITGDQDTVPNIVSDWHDHLLAYRGAPEGAQWALLVKGAGHRLVADQGDGAEAARAAAVAFVESFCVGRDEAWKSRAAVLGARGDVEVLRR